MTICISAGHHPEKPGASIDGFVEHAEAVIWRDLLVGVIPGAISVPVGVLRRKVEFINTIKPDLAVEIHFNDAWLDRNGDGLVQEDEHLGRGSETLYYPGSFRGRAVAEAIQAELGKVFGPDRGAKEGWYRMNPKFGPDYFLARTKCTALIIEPEFVANAETIKHYRASGVAAVARGIIGAIASL